MQPRKAFRADTKREKQVASPGRHAAAAQGADIKRGPRQRGMYQRGFLVMIVKAGDHRRVRIGAKQKVARVSPSLDHIITRRPGEMRNELSLFAFAEDDHPQRRRDMEDEIRPLASCRPVISHKDATIFAKAQPGPGPGGPQDREIGQNIVRSQREKPDIQPATAGQPQIKEG